MIKVILTYIFMCMMSASIFANELTWKLFDKMPIPVAGAEIVTYNEKIYILGGIKEKDGEPITAIQQYDPSQCLEKRWSVVGDMKIARANFVAKLYVKDSCIYITGGSTDLKQENVPTMEKWNLNLNKGEIIGDDIALNRTGATGEIWTHYLVILGGYNSTLPNHHLGYIAIYDLDTGNSFTPAPALANLEYYNQASITTGDSIYIFGGVRSGISNRIYNLNLSVGGDDWPPLNFGSIMPRIRPDLTFPRSSLEAVKTTSDTVWLIGGYSEDSTALRTTSRFIIKREKNNRGYEHNPAPSMLEARKKHVAAELNEVIYVFGGLNEHDKVLDTVEAYIDTVLINPCDVSIKNESNGERSFRLKQNYPNPFNNSTTIEFDLPFAEYVQLDIYTSSGRRVTSLIDNKMLSGDHRVVWDGRSSDGELMPSGVYLYKLTTEHEQQTRKMLLVK